MKKSFQSLSDAELLQKCRRGDSYAFEVFFSRYWKRLYTYSYKILDNEYTADEIVQEVFIKFWEQLKNTQNQITLPEAYLFTATKRTIANRLRQKGLSQFQEQLFEDTIQIISRDNDSIEFEDTQRVITAAIDELPEKCRDVFYLSRFEELNNKEIAEKLGISIRTVETHISNALKFLKNHKELSKILTIVSLMLI